MKLRSAAALAAACAVHGGLLVVLATAKRIVPTSPPAGAGERIIDLEAPPPDEPHTSASIAPLPEANPSPERGARVRAGGALAKTESREGAPSPGTAAPEPAEGWSFSPFTTRIDTTHGFTLGPQHREAPPSDASPPAPASTTGGLAEGLAARDVEAGVSRGGGVLAAAEAATRGPEAPSRGDATFDVVVRPDGAVEAKLASASGDVDAWREVAAALSRSIDGRRVRVPPGSRGLHVVVRVEAKILLADGRETRSLHGARGGVTPSALSNALEGKPGARGSSTASGGPDHVTGEGGEPLGGALGPEKPRNVGASAAVGVLMRVLPTPTVSVDGKVCSATLAVTPLGVGLGGGCSLENIGNGTHRAVSGRIVKEESL